MARNQVDDLNRRYPIFSSIGFGTLLQALIKLGNSVAAFHANGLKQAAAGLAKGSAHLGVATTAIFYTIAGVLYNKAAVAAGTALAAGTIPADKWGIYRYQVNAAGTISALAGAANFSTGYNTEALAKAALPALTAANVDLGYVTVKTAAGQTFVGGTDALKTGTGGNPASETNYYDAAYAELPSSVAGFPLTELTT